jgi:NDP-sugar pyrophosphorylase family protein
VLEPNVFDILKSGAYYDMPTLFNRLQERDKKTIVYPIHEPWMDVGHVDDLKRAQKYHLRKS